MRVSKVNEFIGSSTESFEKAANSVVERANLTLRGVKGIDVLDKRLKIEDGRIAEYRVTIRLIFDMAPESVYHW